MSEFCKLWPGGPLFAQSGHFRLGTDSVLLADFVNTRGLSRGIDLGCGSGAIALLLLVKAEKLHMTGLELYAGACDTARENMAENGLSHRCDIVNGDIRRVRELYDTGAFDLAVSNPPYFPAGSGKAAANAQRAAARDESACSMDELCAATAFLLKTGGKFFVVHRPERLSQLFCAMSARGIEPKRLRLVEHTAGSAPSLALVEGRRGGAGGLIIEPPLVLKAQDGGDSPEIKRIYHMEDV